MMRTAKEVASASSYHLRSPSLCSSSATVVASGSRNTNAACQNATPCFVRLAKALCGSHSSLNRKPGIYFRAVTVTSICAAPASAVTPTVVRVGFGSGNVWTYTAFIRGNMLMSVK
jgi:hypothetical protein